LPLSSQLVLFSPDPSGYCSSLPLPASSRYFHSITTVVLDLIIIQVIRPQAVGSERDPRISWFVYIGQDIQEGLAQIALLYGLRFGQEHGYRFKKQSLLWTEPRLRTTEQFDRWSHVVTIVHNLIVLARDFIEGELRPWENKQRERSPQQVRRGLATFLPELGTPAHPLNLEDIRKVAHTACRFLRPSASPLFVKRAKCLKLFQLDKSACNFFSISLAFVTIYGASRGVPVLSAGPNVNHQASETYTSA
jgi:hypothetical protein